MNKLTKDAIFGDVLCYMYSVEWQERGNEKKIGKQLLITLFRPKDG